MAIADETNKNRAEKLADAERDLAHADSELRDALTDGPVLQADAHPAEHADPVLQPTAAAPQTEPVPSAAIGGDELKKLAVAAPLRPARSIPEMDPGWRPDEIRFTMTATPAHGGGKIALGAIVGPTDDPADVFHKLLYAIWQGRFIGESEAAQTEAGIVAAATPASHCSACGAPNWAGDPRKVGK